MTTTRLVYIRSNSGRQIARVYCAKIEDGGGGAGGCANGYESGRVKYVM